MPASTSSCSIFRRTHSAYRWLQSIISVEPAALECCHNSTAAPHLKELQRVRLQRQQAIGTSIIIWSVGVFGILLAYAAWVRHHLWLDLSLPRPCMVEVYLTCTLTLRICSSHC